MNQPQQALNIALVKKELSNVEYIKQRARGAYISSMSQPGASFALSKAAQTTQPNDNNVNYINRYLIWQKQNANRGLTMVRLNLNDAKLFVFVDASFANNADRGSQIGFVVVLGNERQLNASAKEISITGNIVHWSSTKCKRVTRSVLASELYGMVAGLDNGIAMGSTLDGMLGRHIPLILCTDSFSLYDCLMRLGSTAEKRLMIDIMAMRESYERREIQEIRWIDGNCNPADAMTKDKPCNALRQLVETNQLTITTNAWVERPAKA